MKISKAARAAAIGCACALLATSCSIKQEVTRLDTRPTNVCIVEHDAVRDGVLTAISEGLQRNGMAARQIKGQYSTKHNALLPTWAPADAAGCDALVFYTARWSWDLTTYMSFANIWMSNPDGTQKLAQATYDATGGGGRLDKFINAREKILELVDQMVVPGA